MSGGSKPDDRTGNGGSAREADSGTGAPGADEGPVPGAREPGAPEGERGAGVPTPSAGKGHPPDPIGIEVGRPRRGLRLVGVATLMALLAGTAAGLHFAFRDAPPGAEPVRFTVPTGATFTAVTDTLEARGLVQAPSLFRFLARVRRDDRGIRAGVYESAPGTGWIPLLDQLVAGRMVTVPLTIPEGFTLRQIAERLAVYADRSVDEVESELLAIDAHEVFALPGPGLEGYLFPDTYRFAPGVDLDTILGTLAERYRSVWTDGWRARADSLGLSEREVTTLASIVQAEARHVSEMPVIAGVFHNRLRIGLPLQADPTVQYALGERRARLLYADIDSVSDHPYNTYAHAGLPPGPIGVPGHAALEATLYPADVPYLYFVARPDGTHIFTSSLDAHNRARVEARSEWDALERATSNGP